MEGMTPFSVLNVGIGPRRTVKMNNVGTVKTGLKNQGVTMCCDDLSGFISGFGANPNVTTIRRLQTELLHSRYAERTQIALKEQAEKQRDQLLETGELLEDLLDPDYEGPNGTFVSEIAEEFDLDYLLGFVIKIVLKVGDKKDKDAIKLLQIAKDHLEKRIEILNDL